MMQTVSPPLRYEVLSQYTRDGPEGFHCHVTTGLRAQSYSSFCFIAGKLRLREEMTQCRSRDKEAVAGALSAEAALFLPGCLQSHLPVCSSAEAAPSPSTGG